MAGRRERERGRERERERERERAVKENILLKPCNRLFKKGVGIVSIPSEGCIFRKEKENRTDTRNAVMRIGAP
jgi:hypothetical protein